MKVIIHDNHLDMWKINCTFIYRLLVSHCAIKKKFKPR